MTDLDKLEMIAKAATQGEWKAGTLTKCTESSDWDEVWKELRFPDPGSPGFTRALTTVGDLLDEDVEHIAAFDPPTALALIEAVRDAERMSQAADADRIRQVERIAKLEQELADTKARAERHYDRLLATQRSLARERERARSGGALSAGRRPMSDLDLDKLKNIAEVAEEGWPDDPIRLVDPYSDPLEFEDKADEEYLKAFDPPTALALIRELEQALACCVHDGGSLVFESASLSGPNGEPLWSGDLAPSQRDIREQALHGFSAALERQGLEADALEMRDRMVRYYEEREYYRAWARTWKRLARNLFRELKIAMERQQADQKYIEQLEQNLNSLQVLCDYRAQTIKKTRNE